MISRVVRPAPCVVRRAQDVVPPTANLEALDEAVAAAAPHLAFVTAAVAAGDAADGGRAGAVVGGRGGLPCVGGGMRAAVKNSFGFGGTNCSLVFGAA